MSWESIMSWYLAGATLGLCIANWLVRDEVLSLGFLIITLGFIVAQLCILLWVVVRSRHSEWR